MAKVEITVEDAMVDNGRGGESPGVKATCSECDHEVECLGRTQRSVKRCAMLLKEECPNNEDNFYLDPDMDDRPAE